MSRQHTAISVFRSLHDPFDGINNLRTLHALSKTIPGAMYLSRFGQRYGTAQAIDQSREPVPWDHLKTLPDGTLGKEWVRWVEAWGTKTHLIQMEFDWMRREASWPVARLLKFHDLHHVVTGYEPTQDGELALQGFSYGTGEGEFLSLLGLAGHPWIALKARDTLDAFRSFWEGDRTARELLASPLLTFPFELFWDQPLSEVRERMGIPPQGLALKDRRQSVRRT